MGRCVSEIQDYLSNNWVVDLNEGEKIKEWLKNNFKGKNFILRVYSVSGIIKKEITYEDFKNFIATNPG
jgi:hypothetical protein